MLQDDTSLSDPNHDLNHNLNKQIVEKLSTTTTTTTKAATTTNKVDDSGLIRPLKLLESSKSQFQIENNNNNRNISKTSASSLAGGLSSASSSSSRKKKRVRTSFKHQQLRVMKAHFQVNQNPDSKELKELSERTGLQKRVLQVRIYI